MQILGILVRTRTPGSTETWFPYADQILEASREHGHIFIDLAADMATRENLVRLMGSIGSPRGALWKLIVFYCAGNENSPIDQNGQEFITSEVIARFAGWGVFCLGCNVGQSLGHSLLQAGAHFSIAFKSQVAYAAGYEDEFFTGLNTGILRMLKEGIGSSAAISDMRQFFTQELKSAVKPKERSKRYGFLHALTMLWNAESLEYCGSSLHDAFASIKPGREHAAEYQRLVAKTLHDVLTPHLDEPHLEVSNQSGASRYDIVFMNRADRGFWNQIKISHGNSIVIFDAKNKNRLGPSDADQMLRYSGPWRGKVVFIVCRQRPSKNFRIRTADLLKENGVCLIVLADEELQEMHALREQGNDPTIVIERLYRDRIERA